MQPGRDLQAGGRLAQHGHDEFRALSDDPALQGQFKHDWEEPYLEGIARAACFKNTFADIEYILTTCAENDTRFEIECYDIGHLYTLAHFLERGVGEAAAVRAVACSAFSAASARIPKT